MREPPRRPPATLIAFALILALILLGSGVAHAAPSELDALVSRGWIWAYLGVFVAGVLTSLTPCVYPMIPIVVGIFGARDQATTRVRAFALASLYVLGMGVMYSALGVGVALAGKAFGAILANPWVVIPMVALYTALAASMFGAFELNLPAGLQAKLSGVGGRGGAGAFGMGLVGGLTAAPCTGPILAGILAFVATTRNVPVGFTLLFTFALGMGVLFFAIAVFAVSLPRSGRWMEGVKSVAGLALLVMGLYFLRPIVPALGRITSPRPWFLATALSLAGAGLILGAVHLSFHDRLVVRLRKAFAVALTVAGLSLTINWLLTPRRALVWQHDEVGALAAARASQRPVLLDFGAEWCLPCKELEAKVFADPLVHAELKRFTTVKVDLTEASDASLDAKARWQAATLPTVIVLDGDGREVQRWGEPIPSADEVLRVLLTVE